MSEKKVTSIKELKAYAKGQIVRLPDFAEGQEFYARLKRPSMLKLVKENKIPNALLTKAGELFSQSKEVFDPDNEGMMDELFGVMDILAEASFVEPTYNELKEAGIELTDEQLMFVFSYSQKGVEAYSSFRTDEKDRNSSGDGEEVRKITE